MKNKSEFEKLDASMKKLLRVSDSKIKAKLDAENLLPLPSLLLLGASSCFALGLGGVLLFCKQLQVTNCI